MKTLSEVFDECVDKCGDDQLKAERRFIVEAKKNNTNVSMIEVRKHLGYWDSDQKKDAVLSNKFSAQVFHPVRNYITSKMFNMTSNEAAALWKNAQKGTDLPEETVKQRNKVKEKLPKATRESRSKESMDLSEIIDLDF